MRSRLTATLVLVVLAVVAAVSLSTAVLLRSGLTESLDGQLTGTASRLTSAIDAQPAAASVGQLLRGQEVGTLVVLLDTATRPTATVVRADGTPAQERLSDHDLALLSPLRPGDGVRPVAMDRDFDYRVVAVTTSAGTAVIGLPLNPLSDVIRRLVVVEVVVGGIAVVVGSAATALVVRRGLAPLGDVSRAALLVSRLPLAGRSDGLPGSIARPGAPVEVARVADAVDRMVVQVRSALQERDAEEERRRRFVADASHELRTPLAVVQAHAENALAMGDLPTGAEHAVQRIQVASERMASLVDDLLLLAQLDAGQPLAGEVVPLSRLVLEAVADAHAADADRRWFAELPEEPVDVLGDGLRLHQVLSELLRNAARYTPPGTTVTTTITTTVTEVAPPVGGAPCRHVDVVVSDDGPGVPEAVRSVVFDRFTHGDSARSRATAGGAGLGLAIARSIATAHGGALDLLPVPAGAAFRLRLPVHRVHPVHQVQD